MSNILEKMITLKKWTLRVRKMNLLHFYKIGTLGKNSVQSVSIKSLVKKSQCIFRTKNLNVAWL